MKAKRKKANNKKNTKNISQIYARDPEFAKEDAEWAILWQNLTANLTMEDVEIYRNLSPEQMELYRDIAFMHRDFNHNMIMNIVVAYGNLPCELRWFYVEQLKKYSYSTYENIMNIVPSEFFFNKALGKTFIRSYHMQGIGHDIAWSFCLSKTQKLKLIKACEQFLFNEASFNAYEKSLLYRVRNKHHIKSCGLSAFAKPSSILDIILCF